jgi:nucleotide-binding universal stress UspA family protein
MRISVATDGSDSADRAVDFAAKLAHELKSGLKIIHVINMETLPSGQLQDYARQEHVTLGEILNSFAEEKLTAARRRAEALGVSHIQLESPFGDVVQTVIDAARRDKTDLIVVGRRGRGRLSGLILGSVSQKVTSLAPCAVVVVP